MAIRPIKFNLDGSVDIYHDERGHGGNITKDNIKYVKKPDGVTDDTNFIALECPVAGCNSASIHPASGGCDLENIKRLFELKATQ